MYDPREKKSLYVKHKLNIEEYIQSNFKNYHIFRVSQIIGRANNTTLINYLIDNVLLDKKFEVWGRTTRNLIALTDVYNIIDYIIKNQILRNKIVNIANPNNISVLEVVGFVEEVLRKKAQYKVINHGFPFESIDVSDIKSIIRNLNVSFNSILYYTNAINNILQK
jgi:nucleoside-diphosphate-sugar epimerase